MRQIKATMVRLDDLDYIRISRSATAVDGQRFLFAEGIAAVVQRLMATGYHTCTETHGPGWRSSPEAFRTNICPRNPRSQLGHKVKDTDLKGRTTFYIIPTGGHAPIIELLLALQEIVVKSPPMSAPNADSRSRNTQQPSKDKTLLSMFVALDNLDVNFLMYSSVHSARYRASSSCCETEHDSTAHCEIGIGGAHIEPPPPQNKSSFVRISI